MPNQLVHGVAVSPVNGIEHHLKFIAKDLLEVLLKTKAVSPVGVVFTNPVVREGNNAYGFIETSGCQSTSISVPCDRVYLRAVGRIVL